MVLLAGLSHTKLPHNRQGLVAAKYLVILLANDRIQLLTLTKKGAISTRTLTRAQTLLQADAGAPDGMVAPPLHIGTAAVERTRKRFVERGLDAMLRERLRPRGRRMLEGKQEPFLVACACSTPSDNRKHWRMQLMADKLVELKHVGSSSDKTVRRTLKKAR